MEIRKGEVKSRKAPMQAKSANQNSKVLEENETNPKKGNHLRK